MIRIFSKKPHPVVIPFDFCGKAINADMHYQRIHWYYKSSSDTADAIERESGIIIK